MNVNLFRLTSEKLWFKLIKLIVISLLVFICLSLLAFTSLEIIKSGFSVKTFKNIGLTEIRIYHIFDYLYSLYQSWWKTLNQSILTKSFQIHTLCPFLALIISIYFTISSILKIMYAEKHKFFASMENLSTLDIFGDAPMVFGKINQTILKPKNAASTLVWFGESLGKTASVAIPSIFESNNANIISVDCTGILARLTSGYRSEFTKTFNFDWDKLDNKETGDIYPRWNPLSLKYLPKKESSRNEYVKSISQYLIINNEDDYWEKITSLTLEALLNFFIAKVSHAIANDYYLNILFEEKTIPNYDSSILHSYYKLMDSNLVEKALKNLKNETLNIDNYLPIGSWFDIPTEWQGKDLCFPMFVDYLISRYAKALSSGKEETAWKDMLSDLREEAVLFGYPQKFIHIFEYLIHLSKKQRKIIFSIIIEALSSFRKASIRERTSLSDFNWKDTRGIINKETGKKDLTTIYTSAYSADSLFMTNFFLDMLLAGNRKIKEKNIDSPLFFIIDDFESLPKLKFLNETMESSKENNISFMLLTNSVESLQEIYDKDSLENIINKTEYKLLSSNNNQLLSNKLQVISAYLQENRKVCIKDKLWSQKSQTYSKLAKGILSSRLAKYITRGKYILLADGYFGRPIHLESLYFIKESNLKEKAKIPEFTHVNTEILNKRHHLDIYVPNIVDIVKESGIIIESEEDITQYISDQKENLVKNISTIKDSRFNETKTPEKFSKRQKEAKLKKDVEDFEEEEDW